MNERRQIPLKQALRVKAAEYWLKLGELEQALSELKSLPQSTWNHPWAFETRIAAMGVLSERDEVVLQA
jgi:hypothetical protein